MNTVIFPGYGDRADYIRAITSTWPRRYGITPHVFPFGTTKPASAYDTCWEKASSFLNKFDEVGCIGISFGGGVALRSLVEYPDLVTRVVCIAAPHRLEDMNPQTVASKYAMLTPSLTSFNMHDVPTNKVMTMRPYFDNVVNPSVVPIEGAINIHTPGFSHSFGIISALLFRGATIARFIQTGSLERQHD